MGKVVDWLPVTLPAIPTWGNEAIAACVRGVNQKRNANDTDAPNVAQTNTPIT